MSSTHSIRKGEKRKKKKKKKGNIKNQRRSSKLNSIVSDIGNHKNLQNYHFSGWGSFFFLLPSYWTWNITHAVPRHDFLSTFFAPLPLSSFSKDFRIPVSHSHPPPLWIIYRRNNVNKAIGGNIIQNGKKNFFICAKDFFFMDAWNTDGSEDECEMTFLLLATVFPCF